MYAGSMDLVNFPKLAYYFCKNLPEGYGKGKKCVLLVLDGHSSRWSPIALRIFQENNVHLWVIASHSSVWGQVRFVRVACCAHLPSLHLTPPHSTPLTPLHPTPLSSTIVPLQPRLETTDPTHRSKQFLTNWRENGVALITATRC